MANSGAKIVFGTAAIAVFETETSKQMLAICEKHGVKELDTAFSYVRLLHFIYTCSIGLD